MAVSTSGQNVLIFNPREHEWSVHIRRLEQYFIANAITDANIKRANLLYNLSEEAYLLVTHLCMPNQPEETSYANIVKHLSDYYDKSSVVWVERTKFYSAVKNENESVQEWGVRLKSLARNCTFGNQLDSKLTDIFITQFNTGKVKRHLFGEKADITFEQAVEKAKIEEASQSGISETNIGIKREPEIHRLSRGRCTAYINQQQIINHRQRVSNDNRNSRGQAIASSASTWQSSRQRGNCDNAHAIKQCHRCAKKHASNLCPYKEYVCHSCNGKGHLSAVAKQITTLAGEPYDTNKLLSQAMGVMQHHDAITGTEKVHVEKDYHRSLVKGMQKAISDINTSFLSILGLEKDLNLKSCLLSNVSICSESDKDKFSVLIYNPLARNTSHYIQIPVNDGTWKITDPSGQDVESQLTEPIRNFDYITKDIDEKVLSKVLLFRAENLPALGYKVYKFKKSSSENNSTRAEVKDIDQIGFKEKSVEFDSNTKLLKSITLNGETMAVSQKMMYYVSGGSSAYVFEPESKTNAVEFGDVEQSVLSDGNLVKEIKQVWKDWVTQIIRIYKEEDFIEFDWLIGPADVSDGKGKEIITRYTTELDPHEEFYTDANGREMIYRKKNFRPTFEYTDEEPQAGNYYPVATKILVKDGKREFAVLPDRSQGGASLSSGEVELMLSRALVIQDFFGENLNEEEYKQALVVRGSHFVTLGDSSQGNGGRTMAAVERDIAQRKLLQPWVFYTSEDNSVKEQSFLNKELPANVHLLTLETWNQEENSFLIRLEHILEKNEDPELSKEVTVDISDLFKTFKIKSMKEYLLAANTPLEESIRLKWGQISETEDDSSPLNIKNRLTRDEDDLKVTLAPMQIRTFIATVEPN